MKVGSISRRDCAEYTVSARPALFQKVFYLLTCSADQCASTSAIAGFFFVNTRVIFYVRRIGLYLYKYRIYGTITIYILKGLAPVYHLI